MFKRFEELVTKDTPKARVHIDKKRFSSKLLIFLASAASLFSIEVTMLSKVAFADFSSREPVLLAQQPNSRVAHMMCGPYDVVIRYLGNDEFSYQTRGLYLENGYSSVNNNGDIVYDFFNSDFEYRVVARLDGTGTLMVAKYGETLMTKSCTWD